MSSKPILLSGLQPTNKLTLGNYLGAIKSMVKAQNEYNCYIFVADWHSVTIPLTVQHSTYKNVEKYKWELIKTLVACGVDPNKSVLFIQSDIKQHLELFYFLLTHSYLGELKRMTQYKNLIKKFTLANGTEMSLMGLLIYPMLMAADILIYDVDYVAIGEDQTQHLELTIDIAERINSKYQKNIFKIPKALTPQQNKAGIKIKDLQNPLIKMSKSNESDEGTIFLSDPPEVIKSKIMKSKTDSVGIINLDRVNQPGIVNLIEIYAALTEITVEEAFNRTKNNTYKELKEVVAELVIRELKPIQERLKSLNEDAIKDAIAKNNEFCRGKTQSKLDYIFENL